MTIHHLGYKYAYCTYENVRRAVMLIDSKQSETGAIALCNCNTWGLVCDNGEKFVLADARLDIQDIRDGDTIKVIHSMKNLFKD